MRRLIALMVLSPALAFGQSGQEKRAALDKMLDALRTMVTVATMLEKDPPVLGRIRHARWSRCL